jgi:deoxyadenosine/deoxycytidine kinase
MRAEQEQQIRAGSTVGVTDGGLEQDFQVFTRYFQKTGRLSQGEYDLCLRLYQVVRRMLPPPDVIIALDAPDNILISRFMARSRATEVIKPVDIPVLSAVVEECIETLKNRPIIRVNAAVDDPGFVATVAELRLHIASMLGR